MTGTVTIHGREYVTVAARVQAALAAAGKYEMVSSDVLPLGNTGRFYVRVAIHVDGRQYVGTAEVHLEAKRGTADGDNPLETAETSALGRALGFAGYGSVESVASADEVVRSEQRQQTQPQAQPTKAATPVQNVQKAKAEANKPASPDLLNRIADGCKRLGKPVPEVHSAAEGEAILFALREEYAETQKASVN